VERGGEEEGDEPEPEKRDLLVGTVPLLLPVDEQALRCQG